jgi:hypothetical protein
MGEEPELIIGYDVDSFPTTAVCSACGAAMADPSLTVTDYQDTLEWFSKKFALHLRKKHGPDSVN